MSTTKERLIKYLQYKKITHAEFNRICGFSGGFISAMRNNISDRSLEIIENKFPDINPAWLKLGQGNMLKKGNYVSVEVTVLDDLLSQVKELRDSVEVLMAKLDEKK